MASPLSDEVKQDLLMAKSPQGCPGLLAALENGHVECVKGYLSLVMSSPLSDEFKQNLADGEIPGGLFLALRGTAKWPC